MAGRLNFQPNPRKLLIYIEIPSRVRSRVTENRERKTEKDAHFCPKCIKSAREREGQKSAFSLGKTKKRPLTVAGERPVFEGIWWWGRTPCQTQRTGLLFAANGCIEELRKPPT